MFRWLRKALTLEPPPANDPDEVDRFLIPDNRWFLTQRTRRLPFAPTYHRSRSIQEFRGRYAIMRPIEGHPDLHEYLWDRIGKDLPEASQWVIRAYASLAHPVTNIIFATTGGTHGLIFRVSRTRAKGLPDLATEFDDESSGFVWLRSRWNVNEDRRLLAGAFDDAAFREAGP